MIIIVCGFLFSVSVYLLLERSIVRRVFGLILMGSTINLVIFICGRLNHIHPPFIGQKESLMANPLPQALILTAIVIGFGLLTFLCALLKHILGQKND